MHCSLIIKVISPLSENPNIKGNKMEAGMRHTYPQPEDVGIKIPLYLIKDRFRQGFSHALHGRQITRSEHLKLSFREGYRAGKLFLKELRKENNILEFPFKAKVAMRVRNFEIA